MKTNPEQNNNELKTEVLVDLIPKVAEALEGWGYKMSMKAGKKINGHKAIAVRMNKNVGLIYDWLNQYGTRTAKLGLNDAAEMIAYMGDVEILDEFLEELRSEITAKIKELEYINSIQGANSDNNT